VIGEMNKSQNVWERAHLAIRPKQHAVSNGRLNGTVSSDLTYQRTAGFSSGVDDVTLEGMKRLIGGTFLASS